MKSRSATAAAVKNAIAAAQEAERLDQKRQYNRKSLVCRLCLRTLPKEQLVEIFGRNGTFRQTIRSAVGIEASRKDRSVRICLCCFELVHLLDEFRATCERADVLFSQNVDIPSNAFWNEEADQKAFEKCRSLVGQYKLHVENLFSNQLAVICDVQTKEALEEQNSPVSYPEEATLVKEMVDIDQEGNIVKVEPEDEMFLEEERLEEPHSASEADFDGSELDDPDFIVDDLPQTNTASDDEEDSSSIVKEKLPEANVVNQPRRRGRPCLPEEMLKRRKRKPGEPKKKPGPKNHFKLPPQSVCEICGVLVSRENQERHRNEHLGHRPYVCTIEGCSHAFASKGGLHGHLARHADRDKVYECDICGAKIKTKSSLHRHKKLHTAEKPHGCDICGKRFWRKAYLNHHATVHTGIAKFPCEYCGFVFKNKYWRSFHVKQKHIAKGEAPKFEPLEELPENAEMAEVMEEGGEMDLE